MYENYGARVATCFCSLCADAGAALRSLLIWLRDRIAMNPFFPAILRIRTERPYVSEDLR